MTAQPTPPAIWPLVHTERRRLVADLAELPADAWQTPSLCAGWDVHDVLAHLVDCAKTTRLGFARRLLAARFDFDRDNDNGVRRERRADPRDTLAAFAALAGATNTPPAPLATRLVEEFVHGEDIRRPLGIAVDLPAVAVAIGLGHQVRTSVAFGGGRQRVAGLRLVATDTDVAVGSGPAVSGRAIDLLLVVSGRPVPAGALTGAGAAELLSR